MDVRSCWPFPHRPAWLLGFSLLSALVSLSAEAQPPRRTPATPVSLWALPTPPVPLRPRPPSVSLWAMATPTAVPKPTAGPATARTLGLPADRWPLAAVPQRHIGPAWRRILLPGQPVAAPYQPLAERHAARFGLNPALVLAVIHVESNGNPAAISPKNARGLMQLVPTAGGREAQRFLTGDPMAGPPTPAQLADPDNNILLGTAYLYQLLSQELADLAGLPWPVRRELALAAYNWGPERVRRWLVGDRPPLTVAEVRDRLAQRAPLETQLYVQRVNAVLPLYGEVETTPGLRPAWAGSPPLSLMPVATPAVLPGRNAAAATRAE